MSDFTLYSEKPINSSKLDKAFVLVSLLLLSFGMVTLFTSTNGQQSLFRDPMYFVIHQLEAVAVGIVFMFIIIGVTIKTIRKVLPILFFVVLVMCFLTAIPSIGYESNGARRWIKMGFFSFQPSEVAKFVLVLFLANLYAKRFDNEESISVSWYHALIGIIAFVVAVIAQRDFSTAMFLLLLGIVISFLAGVKIRYFVMLLVMGIPIVFLLIFTEKYRVQRLIGFLHPSFDVQGVNYQLIAAKSAISAGGFIGQGISGLSKIHLIPEVQADFLFAGWAEAFGFIGVLVYFCLLVAFMWRVVVIALHADDAFCIYAALGSGLSIVMQSIVNTGVVCGAFPSTGIPLPFFSAGGSAMIVTFCFCGLIINISRKSLAGDRNYE